MLTKYTLGPLYDDAFLLRFLRVKKFNIQDTFTMFENYLTWRRNEDVDDILTFAYPEVQALKASYPHGYHQVDKLGRPIYIECIGRLDLSIIMQNTTEKRMLRYYIREYERFILERLPAASDAAGRRIESSLAIIDLSGLSMKLVTPMV